MQGLTMFPHQITLSIESEFLRGRINREKKFVLEKMYKTKMLTHVFAMYFALASIGNYNFPLSLVSSELQIGDNVMKPILQSIGCA
jgi:hypothetical protein